MNKRISRISYNWFFDKENGENYYSADVGKDGVIEINEVEPQEGMGLHYCVINFECGKSIKIFNMDTITYKND